MYCIKKHFYLVPLYDILQFFIWNSTLQTLINVHLPRYVNNIVVFLLNQLLPIFLMLIILFYFWKIIFFMLSRCGKCALKFVLLVSAAYYWQKIPCPWLLNHSYSLAAVNNSISCYVTVPVQLLYLPPGPGRRGRQQEDTEDAHQQYAQNLRSTAPEVRIHIIKYCRASSWLK